MAPARADIRMARVFGEHVIVWRDQAIPVYGTAEAGEHVTVTFDGRAAATTADPRGRWRVEPVVSQNSDGTHAALL